MVTKEKADEVLAVLKAEIKAAVANGIEFYPQVGAHIEDGRWIGSGARTNCTCAVGCLLLNRQPPAPAEYRDDVWSASEILKVNYEWLIQVYTGVVSAERFDSIEKMKRHTSYHPEAARVAWELRRYGDELMAEKGGWK